MPGEKHHPRQVVADLPEMREARVPEVVVADAAGTILVDFGGLGGGAKQAAVIIAADGIQPLPDDANRGLPSSGAQQQIASIGRILSTSICASSASPLNVSHEVSSFCTVARRSRSTRGPLPSQRRTSASWLVGPLSGVGHCPAWAVRLERGAPPEARDPAPVARAAAGPGGRRFDGALVAPGREPRGRPAAAVMEAWAAAAPVASVVTAAAARPAGPVRIGGRGGGAGAGSGGIAGSAGRHRRRWRQPRDLHGVEAGQQQRDGQRPSQGDRRNEFRSRHQPRNNLPASRSRRS